MGNVEMGLIHRSWIENSTRLGKSGYHMNTGSEANRS